MTLFNKALSGNNKERANGTTLFGVKRLDHNGNEVHIKKVFSYPDIAVDAMLNSIERSYNSYTKRTDPDFKFIFTDSVAQLHRQQIVQKLIDAKHKEFSYTIEFVTPNGIPEKEYFRVFPVSLHCDPCDIPKRM